MTSSGCHGPTRGPLLCNSVSWQRRLLFLGMLFTGAAVARAILTAFVAAPKQLMNSATFHFARAVAYNIANIYMIKMAGVFMITTSTVAIYTGFSPRWLAVLANSYLLCFCWVAIIFAGASSSFRCGCF